MADTGLIRWTADAHALIRKVIADATPRERWGPRYHCCDGTGNFVGLGAPNTDSATQAEYDGKFCAIARSALPEALDEIERLQAHVALLEYQYQQDLIGNQMLEAKCRALEAQLPGIEPEEAGPVLTWAAKLR